MAKLTELVAEKAAPLCAQAGCTLWDVEYVREAGTWFLRVYLDKDGGVAIGDCEAVSRPLGDWLDEADPIQGSYTLEVSSAGAERVLRRSEHFAQHVGAQVRAALYRPRDGQKELIGTLLAYEDGAVTLACAGETIRLEKGEAAQVRLYVNW